MTDFSLSCPLPESDYPQVLLAHGGGGRLTQQLIEKLLLPAFSNPLLAQRHDGAVLEVNGSRLAFTTDSYVVQPHFFPGGDIGLLAAHGTLNDLAMCGARPLCLSLSLILEEGFPMADLRRVIESIRRVSADTGVPIATGDTKVVERGKGDGIYINTAGIGLVAPGVNIGPGQVKVDDAVLLSGDLGRHGMAIMAQREHFDFESVIESDSAPLTEPALALVEAGLGVHCLRDLTRGGLTSALVEIAEASATQLNIREAAIAVPDNVRGACEILGLDPLHVANEGRFVAFVSASDAARALAVLRAFPVSRNAVAIGAVTGAGQGRVFVETVIGGRHILDMLSGEQLPRIC